MKFNFNSYLFAFIKSQNFSFFKKLAIFAVLGFSLTNRNLFYNKKIGYALNPKEIDVNINKDADRMNKHKLSELDFHIRNLENYLEFFFNCKRFNNTLSNVNQIEKSKIKNYSFDFYHLNKTLKKLSKEVRKIDKVLRNYLNSLDDKLSQDIFHSDFDFNEIISQIRKIEEIKQNIFTSKKEEGEGKGEGENNINHHVLENYLFLNHELLILRLFSVMLIIHKNSTEAMNILSKDNIEFILNHSREKLLSETKKKEMNESIIYFVNRIFLNHTTSNTPDYFYSDYLIELNKEKNFKQYLSKEEDKLEAEKDHASQLSVDKDDSFDYDIVFICGLNSEFSKTWRVPRLNAKSSLIKYLQFLLVGKHIETVYSMPSYELWIPKMFESHTFKDKNIRYLVTNAETKLFPYQLDYLGIPDYTIDEIADKICNSLSSAGVGKRPFVIVSHSMGGLICKKVLNRAEKNGKLIDNTNLKGVVFFSTPHFGSNIVYNILDIAINKYFKYFQIFHTTSNEYGLYEDDIKATVIDFKYTKATQEICFQSKEEFEKQHLNFKKIGVEYICINETEETYVTEIGRTVHVVDPESCYLPETKNYYLDNKVHSDVQKFSPENFEEEGYKILTQFIKNSLFES